MDEERVYGKIKETNSLVESPDRMRSSSCGTNKKIRSIYFSWTGWTNASKCFLFFVVVFVKTLQFVATCCYVLTVHLYLPQKLEPVTANDINTELTVFQLQRRKFILDSLTRDAIIRNISWQQCSMRYVFVYTNYHDLFTDGAGEVSLRQNQIQ